jgi:ribosomal protein L11 methyltransferase
MILSVLSDISSDPHYTSPSAIFDLGTGSGILAIAAAKLFAVPVIANDIDSHAVQNAQENSLLNRLESFITTTTTPTEAIAGQFELIIANVYGEVLIQLAPQVSRLSAPGATLILSGITELVCDSVIDAYTSSADTWRIEQELSEGGWVCLVLKRL